MTPTLSAGPTFTSTPAAEPTNAPAWLFGQNWTRVSTARKVVALTFDAGANDAGIPAILATLSREHVPATFFMTGVWALTYPSQARQIAASFRIGDHSLTHARFTGLTADQIRHQVLDAAAAIKQTTGATPAPFFRFPYGDRSASILAEINTLGYVAVGWTVDTLGWQGAQAGVSTASILNRVLAALSPGEIVLMHVGSTPGDGSTPDANALPEIIKQLRARQYGFVTLDAMLTR